MSEGTLDCRGLLCPLPVIRTQDTLKKYQVGDVLTVYCTDPGALHDIPAWCRIHGHEVVKTEDQGEVLMIQVRVKAVAS